MKQFTSLSKIKVIDLDGRVFFENKIKNVFDYIKEGKLVIFKNYLQHVGMLNEVKNLIFRLVDTLFDKDKGDAIRASGIEYIHNHLNPKDIKNLYIEIRKFLALKMPSFTANIVYDLDYKSDFYVHEGSSIRFMLPYCHQKEFSSNEELGKLTLHGPHHDFFQNVPLNAINTWVAVSNVRAENSMFIYPERWNTRVCQGENGAAKFDQDLGTPLEFELDKGDMLMFHSNHLHSSRLNSTNETRIVLSNRFTLGQPNFPTPLQPQLYFKNDCFENIEDCKGIFDNNEFLGKRKVYRKINAINKIILKISRLFGLNMLSKDIPSEVDYSKDVRISGSLDSILEGEIRVLDKKKCVTRSDGLLIVFSRRCPHQGALLDHAVIKDGKVICPYHGAKFCLKTGKSNCPGLSPLTIKNENKSNQTYQASINC